MNDIFELQQGEMPVVGPSGAVYHLLTDAEVSYFSERVRRYTSDNHFANISDLQDIDRMLMMELLCWRWNNWLAQEKDYWGTSISAEELKRSLNDYSKELRLLKKALGIDKATRDKERGESVAEYIENLRSRAREFGIMREEQSTKAITLFQELKALVMLYNNCTPEERRENSIELHDLLEWIETMAIPEFNTIDEHFKKHSQKFWVKSI